VIDANGVIVDAGDVRVDPSDATRMTVSLRSLTDGVYTVTWKVVSTLDGHQTVGSYPFAVGSANAEAVKAARQSSSARLPFTSLFVKIIMLASLAILAGQRLFIALIWRPALQQQQTEITSPPVWQKLQRVALNGVLLSIAIGILSQAGQSTGREISLPWDQSVGYVLNESRLGLIWLMRLAVALMLFWLINRRDSQIKDWFDFVLVLVLLLTITLTSHAATENKPLIPILADWIHLIGMTFWLGGIVFLYTSIRHLQLTDETQRTQLTSLLMRRFSTHAIIAVAVIGLTGFYSAGLRVGTWSGLWTTLYGHVLLIKQIFVGGLLVIAAINLLILSPRLNRARLSGIGNDAIVKSFGRLLIIDLTLAGLLLASVGFLTYIPPAKTVIPVTDITAEKQADDLLIKININPARVGENVFMLVMVTPDGKALRAAKTVLLRFTPSRANVPPSELQLIGDGSGMFMAKGSNLSFADQWQVQAVVRREDKFDAYANFDIVLKQPGTADNTASHQAGGWILSIGLLSVLITFTAPVDRRIRFGLGIPLALLAISSGVLVLMRPPVVENIRVNPIPFSRESVAAGSAIFVENCVPCHGVTGKGDGPIGLTMNPRPADLTQHAIPGVHPDAQLYEWITNGFPGTRMPPFGSTLSDTDRWNLVNFIRTLAPQ
jgi:copper transport protein